MQPTAKADTCRKKPGSGLVHLPHCPKNDLENPRTKCNWFIRSTLYNGLSKSLYGTGKDVIPDFTTKITRVLFGHCSIGVLFFWKWSNITMIIEAFCWGSSNFEISRYISARKLTWLAGKSTMNKDQDIPAGNSTWLDGKSTMNEDQDMYPPKKT